MSEVPLFASSLEPYHDRLSEAIERVARSGRYILGPEVEAFEEEFARYLGVRHCVGVANGTDALTIALRAAGVGAGDEVVMPSFTFYATAEAALVLGAVPVYCDIDPETFCVTRETVAAALTPRTKAIVPVDLFGNVAARRRAARAGRARRGGRRPGGRRGAERREGRGAGRRGHLLVLPVEEPSLPRRRRSDRHGRRRARRAHAHPALPWLEGQGHLHRRGLELAPRRAPGGRAAGAAARAGRLGRPAARGGGRPTSDSASAST